MEAAVRGKGPPARAGDAIGVPDRARDPQRGGAGRGQRLSDRAPHREAGNRAAHLG